MYSDFLLLDGDSTETERIERLAFGDTSDRNEAWLQDTLFRHEQIIPVRDLDSAFGPLIPVCRELRTEAGPVDIAFINAHGRLTLVECKLWRNPEARRKVVAQILDYARAVSRWSYSDLQRQVGMATGRKGNVPFELAKERHPELQEQQFVDQVSLGLQQGRILLVIAGDGIREDVSSITELITRNAAMGFSFGLVEVALYGMPEGELLVQPRVVARTQIIDRSVVVVKSDGRIELADEFEDISDVSPAETNELGESPRQAAYRQWWQPVLEARFDDPDQDPPKLFWPNNVRAQLPWKGTWITAYNYGDSSGVGVGGRTGADQDMLKVLEPQKQEILAELPVGSEYRSFSGSSGMTYTVHREKTEFADDDAHRKWLAESLNMFVNALRPRIKRLLED